MLVFSIILYSVLYTMLLPFIIVRAKNKKHTKFSEFVSNKFLPQEIEFPTSGLDSVPGNLTFVWQCFLILAWNFLCSNFFIVTGDGEGGIEMTGSLQLIREYCDLVVSPEKTTRTRVVCFIILALYKSVYVSRVHIAFLFHSWLKL